VLLTNLQGLEPVTDHFAGTGIAILLDLALDALLEVFPDIHHEQESYEILTVALPASR
jgi:hypothetical protein